MSACKRIKAQVAGEEDCLHSNHSSVTADRNGANLELITGGLVLMGGFLFCTDCKSFGLAGKRANAIWNTAKSKLPMNCRMLILPLNTKFMTMPSWLAEDMKRTICSHDFLSQVFLKMDDHNHDIMTKCILRMRARCVNIGKPPETHPAFDDFDLAEVSFACTVKGMRVYFPIALGKSRHQRNWSYGTKKSKAFILFGCVIFNA